MWYKRYMLETKEERKRRLNREWMRKDYEINPEKYRQRALSAIDKDRQEHNNYRRSYNRTNPEQFLLASAKHRAKRKELPFDIEVSDIIIPEVCPVLGIKLEKGNGKIHAASPTLDRVDNSKGYVKGNIAVISNKANKHKGDLSPTDIEQLHLYVKGITYNS